MIKQTLFIPKSIRIQFRDMAIKPINHENILVGIRTRAIEKNDIQIYPFLTDKTGCINITAEEIQQKANNYISYGIMDYVPLEYANPIIDIYYWGSKHVKSYLQRYDDKMLNKRANYNSGALLAGTTDDFKKEMEEVEKREQIEYEIFKGCYNLNLPIEDNLLLERDKWNKQKDHVEYTAVLYIYTNQ